jgi:hypothetical protein
VTKPVTDVDGNEISPPEPASDLAIFERLTMFCRRNHIQLGPFVKVGSITVQMTDLDLPTKQIHQSDQDALLVSWLKDKE